MIHSVRGVVVRNLVFLIMVVGCADRPPWMPGADGGQANDSGAQGDGGGAIVDAPFSFPDVAPFPDVPAADAAPNPDGPAMTCGNGVAELTEACDDGNTRPGDGCSGVCTVEPNFTCPTPGQACVSMIVCGDGKISGNEACDDGNAAANDGCSATCTVEPGYACATPGQACTKTPTARCGDSVVNAGETCDDGNATASDGCSDRCVVESGYTCPQPGMACKRVIYCGDGRLDSGEACDDGNMVPGDGCTGACTIEPFYECKTPGQLCTSTIVCGDGKIVGDEACDDGNTSGGDGCAASCKFVEPGFTCPRSPTNMGGPCTAAPKPICGDGKLDYGELCDDGNMTANDGCSPLCKVEPGYDCPKAGMACTLVGFCGDGKLSIADGEQCDDHNTAPGDGCSPLCVIEANFVCPTPGQPCKSTVVCGDGKVTGAEQCDDHNGAGSDGCSATCQREAGWVCPVIGAACQAQRCGDGIKAGAERCDDGNATDLDGCSSTCLIEPQDDDGNGWLCPTPGQACTHTSCGDSAPAGSEQCDDGNHDTGDGCSPFCRVEPSCPAAGGPCTTRCGDGLLLQVDIDAGQECDDGNVNDGDGCSKVCKIERGYTCTKSAPAAPAALKLPVVYRDFNACDPQPNPEAGRTPRKCEDRTPFGHPDFETFYTDGDAGIVQSLLGANGKPVHVAGQKFDTVNNDAGFAPFDYFGVWYKDDANYNKTVLDYLTLGRLGQTGQYQFDAGPAEFFPLDGKGWNQPGYVDMAKKAHNFHFTSEVRYWFEFQGTTANPAPRLDFTGDDDLWVFVNKHLAVDLGGLHEALTGSIILDTATGGHVCDLITTNCNARRTVDLGLVKGNVYEIVVFQAERHTEDSNYRLTLSNFTSQRSSCHSVCGDGFRTPDEACDLGTAMNTGAYGTCNANCTLPARCGDAKVDAANGEQCDDGVNQASYGGTTRACGPGCVFTGFCGDGKVDGAFGEACDEGAMNGAGYGHCTATCRLGPRCGDGVTTDAEECDDGALNGSSGSKCTDQCTKKCGNGQVDPGEECDDGKAGNVGGYGKCSLMCTLGPRCGDGIKNGNETCDDGKNDGTYGTCAAGCVLGPRCGDGVVQTPAGEVCDKGAMNSSSAYGPSTCDQRCQPGPYCGDKQVDAAAGEKCDDGVNSGQPGSCTTDCKDFVPNPSCGDGIMQAGEQCDQGAANGTMAATCDLHCRNKCGNGILDPGEQCDDGVNSGAYGTCNANCTLAGYCGDGVKNGTEQCDLGTGNEASPYGLGKCTLFCVTAPYCGDNRIQSANGEECDGTPGCSPMCKHIIIQ